jgi:8-oxo-dGTP pyrophosphatase MutT (NUDIX family)
LTRRLLVDREPWLKVFEEDVLLPNGTVIQNYIREDSRAYAMCFVRMLDGSVPMVRQYKHGIGEVSWDLPAGYLNDPDEDPLSAAQRELREETGIVAPEWRPLAAPFVDTNRGPTRAHLFAARGGALVSEPQLDPTEDIAISYHSPHELREMVSCGVIHSLPTVAAIMLAIDLVREGLL